MGKGKGGGGGGAKAEDKKGGASSGGAAAGAPKSGEKGGKGGGGGGGGGEKGGKKGLVGHWLALYLASNVILPVTMEVRPDVSELIVKCSNSISQASTDTEKLAGLFVAAQVLKKIENELTLLSCKRMVLESIGPRFLVRLLKSKDSSEYVMYRHVALSILNSFASEKDLAVHPTVLSAIPQVLDVIVERKAFDGERGSNSDEAHEIITRVALSEEGRESLEKCDALNRMVEMCISHDYALNCRDLEIIACLMSSSSRVDYEKINGLLNKAVSIAANDNSRRKFELFSVIDTFLVNCNRDELVSSRKISDDWPQRARNIIVSVLSSRLTEIQRNPSLKLASTILQIFGIEWTLSPGDIDKSFFLLIAHLSAVEVRMQLEDRALDVILINADLIIACFVILEITLSYASIDSSILTDVETEQLLNVGQEALVSVVFVFKHLGKKSENDSEKQFKLALARVIAAWLAHEACSRLPEVLDILPQLIELASESFLAYQSWFNSDKTLVVRPVDLMRLLLPGLCHVSADPKGQKILMDTKAENVLLACFKFHMTSSRKIAHEEDQEDTKAALITLCNVFLNLYLQPETANDESRSRDSSLRSNLLELIVSNLEGFPNTDVLLKKHLIVLALVLVQHSPTDIEFSRHESLFRDAVEFLKMAFIVQEDKLSVNPSYQVHTDQILDLWTLCASVTSSILPSSVNLSELILNSRLAEDLIDSLVARNLDDAPANFTVQVENIVLNLLRSTSKDKFQDAKTLIACRRHGLKRLGHVLFPVEFPS